MQYMLLIHTDRERFHQLSEVEQKAVYQRYVQLYEDLKADGRLAHTSPLGYEKDATRVSRRKGKVMKVDGPFAETKEQLAGYFLVEAADLDEACAIAGRIPDAAVGAIEVRPVHVYGGAAPG